MNEKTVDKYKFVTKDLIGQGSFAQVYKGLDTTNGRLVAIKMIPKQMIQSDKYLMEGLRRELSVMQKLKGNNVVRLLDTLESSNNYYIVQEYCADGDLVAHLRKQQYLTEIGAIRILTDILQGFTELLQQGIIHRDLKPANILVHQNVFKLGDFGFAKCMSNFAREVMESRVGTPLYMAPQILLREPYTSKCDIWSIGCIFYECIFRRTPWMANSVPLLINQIIKYPLQFPSYISADAKDFIQRCLVIEEERRMDWIQVYQHPLVQAKFKDYLEQVKHLEAKAEFIINELRSIIVLKQIDLLETFKKLRIQDNQFLSFKELQSLLNEINPTLTRQEIEFVFNMIDVDKQNQIDFLQFQSCLQKHKVRLSLQEIEKDLVYQDSPLIQMPKWKQELKLIQEKIEEEQLSLVKLFKQFDTDCNKVLDLVEFSRFIKLFNQKITNEEVSLIFQYFDKNSNAVIDFNELKAGFQSQIL